MNCKNCGKPVERSIEGELVCGTCWGSGEPEPAELRQCLIEAERDNKYHKLLAQNGIDAEYVDGNDCQVAGKFFSAEDYLYDTSGLTMRQIAVEMSENIKAVFAETI